MDHRQRADPPRSRSRRCCSCSCPSASSCSSRSTRPGASRSPSGFSMRWYRQIVESPEFRSAVTNSAFVGLVVALVTLVLGTLAAYGLTRASTVEDPDRGVAVPAVDPAGAVLGALLAGPVRAGRGDALPRDGRDRPSRLRDALLPADRGGGAATAGSGARGGGCGPRRERVAGVPAGHPATGLAGPRLRLVSRFRPQLRRVHHHVLRDRTRLHPAAIHLLHLAAHGGSVGERDLEPVARDHARPLRVRVPADGARREVGLSIEPEALGSGSR